MLNPALKQRSNSAGQLRSEMINAVAMAKHMALYASILLCTFLFALAGGCQSAQNVNNLHGNWTEKQWKLFKHYPFAKDVTPCNIPDWADSAGTNFIVKLKNGINIEMIWCPSGTFSVGQSLEEIVEKHPNCTFEDINASYSIIERIHLVYVPGFWISKTTLSVNDFKDICKYVGNDNNDLGRSFRNGLTWSESMRICGAFRAPYNKKYMFRLPTKAELKYAALAGSTNFPNAATTNSWGIEISDDFIWCYDSTYKAPNKDIQTFSGIVTNYADSYFPTTMRILGKETSGGCFAQSPYSTILSPKARVVFASKPKDSYISFTVRDFGGSCPDSFFLHDRLMWATGMKESLELGFSLEKSRIIRRLEEYITFLKPRCRFDSLPVKDEELKKLLQYSLQVEDYVMFRELVKFGVVQTMDIEQPAMILAAQAGSTKFLELLFASGCKINTKNIHGTTPLHAAVTIRSEDNVLWLIKHGADVYAKDNDGYTPKKLAIEHKYYEMLELLDSQEEANPIHQECASGTAWYVNSNTVITCSHVVKDASEIWTEMPGNKLVIFKIIAIDNYADIAVLKAMNNPSEHTYIPLSSQICPLSQNIFTIGYPMPEIMGSEKKYNEGTISALSGIGNDSRFYQISAPLQPGNSGGAIVSESGVVIGLAAAALDAEKVFNLTGVIPQNVNYAVKSRYITALLQDNGIQYEEVPIKKNMNKKELVDFVSRATILIKAK